MCVLPVDVNRSRYRTTTEWVDLPDEPLPDGAGIDRRPQVVRSSGCVVPGKRVRDHWAAPTSIGYGIRLGLHLVKGIGETEGEALDKEISNGGPFKSLADLVGRTELSEEVVERLIRAGALDSLGVPRRQLLWQLREVAGATRGRYDGRSVGSKKAQGRPLDLRLPPTEAPDLPPPSELERIGDAYAILSLDARRQVIELFRPALDRLGALRAGELNDARPGRVKIGGLVVTRQHPMTARGTVFLALEDETGMVNVTLWPDNWARFRRTVRRHALLYVEGRLERESNVVNVIADRVESLSEMARPVRWTIASRRAPHGPRRDAPAQPVEAGSRGRAVRPCQPVGPPLRTARRCLAARRDCCRSSRRLARSVASRSARRACPRCDMPRRKSRYHAARAAAKVPKIVSRITTLAMAPRMSEVAGVVVPSGGATTRFVPSRTMTIDHRSPAMMP